MRNKYALFLSFVVGFVFVFCISSTSLAQSAGAKIDKEITIRMHHGLPVGHYLDNAHKLWAKRVAERSGGKIKIEIYPSSQLYNDKTVVQALLTGAIECAWDYDHKFFSVVKAMGAMGIPVGGIAGLSLEETQKSLFAMFDDFYKGKGPGAYLESEFNKAGLKVNHFIMWTSAIGFLSKYKPWVKPSDLKGRKVRVSSRGEAKMVASVGAQPVSLAGAELYVAAQRGAIEGHTGAFNHLVERKEADVMDWFSYPLPSFAVVGVVAFNYKFWNSLPELAKQILGETGKGVDVEMRPVLDTLDQKYHKQLLDEGSIKYHYYTKKEQLVWADFFAEFQVKNSKALGPTAVKMYNLCQDHKRALGLTAGPLIK